MNRNIRIGSVTYAVKAKRLLSARGLHVRTVKLTPTPESRGCTYGIEVPEEEFLTAVAELRRAQIQYQAD